MSYLPKGHQPKQTWQQHLTVHEQKLDVLQRSLCCHLSSGLENPSELMLRRVKGFWKSDHSSSRKASLSIAPVLPADPQTLNPHRAFPSFSLLLSALSFLERQQASHFSHCYQTIEHIWLCNDSVTAENITFSSTKFLYFSYNHFKLH